MPPIPGVSSNMARVDREGKFTFSNVTPGQYRVMARAAVRPPADPSAAAAGRARRGGFEGGPGGRGGRASRSRCSGRLPTSRSRGQNVTDLALTLQPGMTMTGRVDVRGHVTRAADGSHARPRQPRAARAAAGIRDGRRAAGAGGRDRTLHDHGRRPRPLHALGELRRRARGGRRRGAAARSADRAPDRPAGSSGCSSRPSPAAATSSTSRSTSNRIRTSPPRSSRSAIAARKSPARFRTRRASRPPTTRSSFIRPTTGTGCRSRAASLRPPGHRRQVHVPDAAARRLSPHRRDRRRARRVVQPDFLSQLAAASIAVPLAEGEKKTQDIRVR